ncbi:helix-turn-helix domain-containing protein [Sphingomonas sp. MMS24-J13]|uniref:AraC-like ligand-binding domain-containing protein n=1 Tax=Sphingomonas sp. MMS24-J13 TaxID=3238686 RepID=UPI0038517EDB
MAQLAHFTTDEIAPEERLSRWDASLWKPLVPFRTEAAGEPFSGKASFGRLGPLHLFRIVASAHRLARSPEAVLPAGTGAGLIQLVVQREGVATLRQAGRDLALEPGMWAICDAERAFTMTSGGAGEQLIVLLPRDRLAIAGSVTMHIVRGFGASGGTGRLLPRYLAGLLDEIAAIDDSNCGELADMAAQLVRLALFEARYAAPPVSMRETLRLRVKDYVRRNVRDPALSIARVATAFGCTKRHLHKVFSGDELSLSQFVWSERLERCREALSNPRMAQHSITEISFMWGFNNSAHFSKSFKDRYGLPPGLFREHQRCIDTRHQQSALINC